MGSLIVESSAVSTHTEGIFVESDLKDSKKKKRRAKKSKQTTSVSETVLDASSSQIGNASSQHMMSHEHHQLPKESNVGIGLMSSKHVEELVTDGNLLNQQSVPQDCEEPLSLSSVPGSASSEEPVGPVLIARPLSLSSVPGPASSEEPVGPVLIARPIDSLARRTYFPPHWSTDAMNRALENGELLRAVFRVNAHNRLEAYCKIDGVQTDILLSSVVAQNRAIDGDTVAIVIDSPSLWPRMKGSNETMNNTESGNNLHDGRRHAQDCLSGKCNLDVEAENGFSKNNVVVAKGGAYQDSESCPGEVSHYSNKNEVLGDGYVGGCQLSTSDSSMHSCLGDAHDTRISLEKLCALTGLYPSKRPTGSVVGIIGRSIRRDYIVGFLSVKQWIYSRESKKKNSRKNKHQQDLNQGYVLLTPNDPRFTKMMVSLRNLPTSIKKRLEVGDLTIESDLVAAKVVDWAEESYIPDARVIQVFGRGSDAEAQIAAILFENAIDASEFSSEVLSCLPRTPWEIPQEELESRRDLRNLCIFTIDPSTATELDDALSVEMLPDGNFRVGVHIADVSYFVLPDTALDIDALIRSTSVYLLLRKLPMLPPMLSDDLASLNPGVDRLAFSIIWDMNSAGEVLERWIGRTIIRSCCKLSYEHAQDIINGLFDFQDRNQTAKPWPNLYGQFEWSNVIESVKSLHEIARLLRRNRFEGGALSLESPKVVYLFDEEGVPYDTVFSERNDSNSLVEELMHLANRTAAEVITRTYPSCALLRRHPEPNPRKLRDFQAFCNKHGLTLDIYSSARLHSSLEHIRGEVGDDTVLFDILMSYAARPMQLASYFCSGELKDSSDHGHYALAVPLYTHFTSPLRRYPDIVVHRTLAAALEAEDVYLNRIRMLKNISMEETLERCFTGVHFDKDEIETVEAQQALSAGALRYRVPQTENLSDVAAHCNERKRAARHVKDATDKLYMWLLLRKKQILISEARVLGLGPRFMSIYITKLAIERRIYYDEVDGLTAEWLDTTSTLVLSQSHKRSSKKSSPGKISKTVDEVALLVNPVEGEIGESQTFGDVTERMDCEPVFFPLTLHILSTIPVALHAVGGDDGPLDIVARMYVSSYFH
ncbi:DIS3-like exonuclease 2 [Salvia miltiorrhiza]|uniref:DIS3-like exonuclease 2 n=1 Tax=Salvia miltiorrhiza TaxID=226208 RepID=UPI0025ABB53A|nr:DIS3-like exonuclease 2 [Salvia miltiorrhiza]